MSAITGHVSSTRTPPWRPPCEHAGRDHRERVFCGSGALVDGVSAPSGGTVQFHEQQGEVQIETRVAVSV